MEENVKTQNEQNKQPIKIGLVEGLIIFMGCAAVALEAIYVIVH